jgi:uncharacterized membrane protein YGL010W
MKTLDQWFADYAVSHQNKTNQAIHYVCVPAIFFSIIGMFMSIPSNFLAEKLPFDNPFIENWATILVILLLVFYIKLSLATAIKMLILSAVCIFLNYYLGQYTPLLYTSIVLFVVAWIGQFYGHHIEGAKPSFFKDLQFLLIGPAWVMKKIFG